MCYTEWLNGRVVLRHRQAPESVGGVNLPWANGVLTVNYPCELEIENLLKVFFAYQKSRLKWIEICGLAA